MKTLNVKKTLDIKKTQAGTAAEIATGAEALNGSSQLKAVQNHSHLAMKAAKRMGSSKQKVKTGRTVCRHLLKMLNEADAHQPNPRASRRFQPDSQPSQGQFIGGDVSIDLMSQKAANDRQFSLAF